MTHELSRQIFEKFSNIKFHEKPSSESRVVPFGRTDITTLIATFSNFANAPKNKKSARAFNASCHQPPLKHPFLANSSVLSHWPRRGGVMRCLSYAAEAEPMIHVIIFIWRRLSLPCADRHQWSILDAFVFLGTLSSRTGRCGRRKHRPLVMRLAR
jgi:hypothetical protein